MSPDDRRDCAAQILWCGLALGPARLDQRLQVHPCSVRQHRSSSHQEEQNVRNHNRFKREQALTDTGDGRSRINAVQEDSLSGPGKEPMMASPSTRSPMAKMTASTSVPKSMQATYEAITALTDAFCRDHLNEDYRELARRMMAALCRKRPSPLASGQPRTWACGIIYVLGQINFLTDPSTQPFMTTADLCARFGVGQSTASAKARVISQALDTSRLNLEWTLPSLLDQNPLVWMVEVNGMLVDLRHMPREVQEIAFQKGMIPYIPADQEQGPERSSPNSDE